MWGERQTMIERWVRLGAMAGGVVVGVAGLFGVWKGGLESSTGAAYLLASAVAFGLVALALRPR